MLSTTTLGGATAPTASQTSTIDTLLNCVNDVVETLAIMYFPLKYEEEIISSSGVINLSSFTKTVCEIVSVKDEHGFEVDFTLYPTYIKTKIGRNNYQYCYIPSRVSSLNSNLEVCADKVSIRLVVLGVVSRYYLMQGMLGDANAWQDVFNTTALALQASKRNQVIKKRRWF